MRYKCANRNFESGNQTIISIFYVHKLGIEAVEQELSVHSHRINDSLEYEAHTRVNKLTTVSQLEETSHKMSKTRRGKLLYLRHLVSERFEYLCQQIHLGNITERYVAIR